MHSLHKPSLHSTFITVYVDVITLTVGLADLSEVRGYALLGQ